jgi:hypothetical protein
VWLAADTIAALASTNKCLAQMNKSRSASERLRSGSVYERVQTHRPVDAFVQLTSARRAALVKLLEVMLEAAKG